MRTKEIFMEYHQEEIIEQLQNQKEREMKARITAVQGSGTFDSKFGMLYKYEYTFDDGTILTANHKKEGGNFAVGEEVEYEVKGSNDYGSWGSVKRPEGEFQSKPTSKYGDVDWAKKDRIIARQSSLKVALDYLHQKGFQKDNTHDQLKELTDVAEFITNYVLSDSTSKVVSTPQRVEKVSQNGNKSVNTPSYDSSEEADLERQQASAHLGSQDDLPF